MNDKLGTAWEDPTPSPSGDSLLDDLTSLDERVRRHRRSLDDLASSIVKQVDEVVNRVRRLNVSEKDIFIDNLKHMLRDMPPHERDQLQLRVAECFAYPHA